MTHNRSGYRSGCRCEECTKAQRDYMRGYLREHRQRTLVRTCACGTEFTAVTRRRWCTSQCKASHEGRASRRRAHDGKGWRRRRAEAIIAKAASGTRSTATWIVGTCIECGDAFTRRGQASPFCSTTCRRREARRRRRALERGASVTTTGRHAIYERDNWTCHLCGFPVDPLATVPALDAATLDHVVALARGGEHHERNLKTAHFYCNALKRDLDLSVVA